jgi:serine/threonine-protein kinase
MSPEQCRGAGGVDHRADIYALGCVLFHLLTGHPPFDLPGVGAIISAHLREPPPRPSARMAQLPPGIDEIALRCLAKDPDERFATMVELQQACDALLALITRGNAQTLAMPSSSMPLPIAIPTPALTPNTPPEASRTTLSTSAGQPLGGIPRRRLGWWIAAAALAGGVGSTVAVLSSRTAAREVREPPVQSATAAAADGDTIDAAATLEVAAPAIPAPAIPAPAAEAIPAPPAAPPMDAGAAAAAEGRAPAPHAEPARPRAATPHAEPARPAAPAVIRKPGPARPPAQPRPKRRPDNDDVYDDRN